MDRRNDRFASSYLAPFALWNPLAAQGAAETFGAMLRNTSALLMLATSRTPAQWITGRQGRARQKSFIAGKG